MIHRGLGFCSFVVVENYSISLAFPGSEQQITTRNLCYRFYNLSQSRVPYTTSLIYAKHINRERLPRRFD